MMAKMITVMPSSSGIICRSRRRIYTPIHCLLKLCRRAHPAPLLSLAEPGPASKDGTQTRLEGPLPLLERGRDDRRALLSQVPLVPIPHRPQVGAAVIE